MRKTFGAIVGLVFILALIVIILFSKTPSSDSVPLVTPRYIKLEKQPVENPIEALNIIIAGCQEKELTMRENLCLGLIGNTDSFCDSIPDEVNRESCLKDYLLFSSVKSPENCDRIGDMKYFCKAISDGDCGPGFGASEKEKERLATACRAYVDRDISRCGGEQRCINVVSILLAVKTGDIGYCKDAQNLEDAQDKTLCQAVISGDKSMCNIEKARECERIAFSEEDVFLGITDASLCSQLLDKDQVERCIAVAEKDSSRCGSIEEAPVKELCIKDTS